MRRVEETPKARVELGERLARARIEAGMRNKSAFARAVGVTPNTIYRYERGELVPDVFKLETIASLTGVTTDWLIRGERAPDALAVLEEWTSTPIGASAGPRALAFLRSLPLGGYAPTATFYDLALLAFQRGLSETDAASAARQTAALLRAGDADD